MSTITPDFKLPQGVERALLQPVRSWVYFRRALGKFCKTHAAGVGDAMAAATAFPATATPKGGREDRTGTGDDVREANHRIRNELATLQASMRRRCRDASGGTIPPCASCMAQVAAIAYLHDLLEKAPSELAYVDLADQLAALCAAFGDAFAPDGRIAVRIDADSIPVPHEKAGQLALVVNEALTNAAKHGFPDGRTGSIRVTLRRDGDGDWGRLTVSDDGIGATVAGPPRAGGGTGLSFTAALARSIGGRVEQVPQPVGFCLACAFPIG